MAKGNTDSYESLKKEYTMFTWSYPSGYAFWEVEDAINDYRQAVANAAEAVKQKDRTIAALQQENERLEKLLTENQLQLQSMIVADKSEDDSLKVLNDFKDQHGGSEDVDLSDDSLYDDGVEDKEANPKKVKIDIFQ